MTTYTATLDMVNTMDYGSWVISTNEDVNGHVCEGTTLAELLENYGYDEVVTHSDGSVTFTD